MPVISRPLSTSSSCSLEIVSYDFIPQGIRASLYSSELTHSNPNKLLLLKFTIFKKLAFPNLENRGGKEDTGSYTVQSFLINTDTWLDSVRSTNKYVLPDSPKAISWSPLKFFWYKAKFTWWGAGLACVSLWGWSPVLNKVGAMAGIPSTLEVEAEGTWTLGHSCLYTKFKASLGYLTVLFPKIIRCR